MLVLSAMAMAVSASTLLLVQRSRAMQRVDNGIAADVLQFRSLAAGDLSPEDTAFADVSSLMQVAVQRQVPAEDQTFLALIDGRPRYVPSGDRPVKLEDEPALLAELAALPRDAPVQLRSAQTASGTVRYAAVQVTVAGQPDVGTYVVAYALKPSEDALLQAARLYGIVAAGSLALVGIVGWVVAGRLLRPLRLLRTAAEEISHTDLALRIPVTGNDDVSELTRTLNDMLARLQSAFDTQQQFLDDAGHELRTPLTVVQGHLEVMDVTRPAEVVETRNLVVDELDRMARLVGDLTLLAKSQRPDFVKLAPVELDRLVWGALDRASALGRRHWVVEASTDRWILGDEQRLTQALLQLSDNAVKYTEPADTIAFGVAVAQAEVELWVRDTGQGIAAEDLTRVFERFGRAAGAAGRGDEGSGLGLAIVSAIAVAHGGVARVTSSLGAGSTFTVALPVSAVLPRVQSATYLEVST